MGVAGRESPVLSAIHLSTVEARSKTAGRNSGWSADWLDSIYFIGIRGPSDNDDGSGREPGPICERVDRMLGRGADEPQQNGHAVRRDERAAPRGRRQPASSSQRAMSTPEMATMASPCWRCRARHEPTPPRATVHRVLEAVICRDVLPTLRARHRASPPPLGPTAERLADTLLAPSPGPGSDATIAAIEPIVGPFGRTATAIAPLFERAAGILGDCWTHDSCDDVAITTALAALQAALDGMAEPGSRHPDVAPAVLVVTPPGETHRLGAVLARHCLAEAGWWVTNAAPLNDAALERLVADDWLDVLHIALSPVFRRDHWQARLARSIAGVRAASRNPALVVSVGGRLFSEDGDAWIAAGAEVGSRSAATLHRSIETARGGRRLG